MIKHFAIGIVVLLGSATVSFAGEVAQKVNVDTKVNIPTSTGVKLGDVILDTAIPKPPRPGGTNPLQTRPKTFHYQRCRQQQEMIATRYD